MTAAGGHRHAPRPGGTAPPDDDDGGRMRCPVTGAWCTGILAYLCEDYGCARKGGLSPHPEENV